MILSRNGNVCRYFRKRLVLYNQQSQIVVTKTGVFVTFVCNHTLPLPCDYIVVVIITHSIYIPFILTIGTNWHS